MAPTPLLAQLRYSFLLLALCASAVPAVAARAPTSWFGKPFPGGTSEAAVVGCPICGTAEENRPAPFIPSYLSGGVAKRTAAGVPETGAELWADFVANPGNHAHLPDCAYAGYRRGEVPPPALPVVVEAADYGALGDGLTDNTEAFRLAIDAAWRAGGGAVRVAPGRFLVSGIVLLHRNGVVLRGSGQGQTIIQFTRPLEQVLGSTGAGSSKWNWSGGLIWVGAGDVFTYSGGRWVFTQLYPAGYGNGGPGQAWEYWRVRTQLASVTDTPTRGATTLTVDNASSLVAGQVVLLSWENDTSSTFFKHLGEHPLMQTADYGSWMRDLGTYPRVLWPVEIRAVVGNQVTLAQPLRADVRPEWNVRLWQPGNFVTEAGVEDLSIQLDARLTMGHNTGLGWNGVAVNRAYNCWVRNVEVINGEGGILVHGAKNISVLNTAVVGDRVIHHPYAARSETNDTLWDGFTINVAAQVMHGINTEWVSSGNVWTRGNMNRGTFDSHRAISFDYVRTDITVGNDADSWPGGADQAGRYTARRTVHWNVRVAGSNRPEVERGIYILHPDQFVRSALVGVQGAPVFLGGGVAMPAGDKDVLVLDVGNVPSPANLYDAQVAARREREAWVDLAYPNDGLASPGTVTLRAALNVPAGRAVQTVEYLDGATVLATATAAPWSANWAASVGHYNLQVRATDTVGTVYLSPVRPTLVGYRRYIEEADPDIVTNHSFSLYSDRGFTNGRAWRGGNGGNTASMTYTFTGNRVTWITSNFDASQNTRIFLNDMTTPVATYNGPGNSPANQIVGYDSGLLPFGTHTLRLVDGSETLVLDALVIQTITPPPTVAGPTAVLNANQTSGPRPFALTLDAVGSTAPLVPGIDRYEWQLFDDEAVATTATVSRTLSFPGTYPVRLRLFDSLGRVATATRTVTVQPLPGDVQLDNHESARVRPVGSWPIATAYAGYRGPDYATDGNTGKGQKSFAYLPEVTEPGTYEVFLRWPQDNTQATNVPVDIVHDFGRTRLTINQATNGGKWQNLGRYRFTPGAAGLLRLLNEGTTATVAVDGALFLKSETAASNLPPVASFTDSQRMRNGRPATLLDGRSSRDFDGTVTNYSWSFPDGTTATGAIVEKEFLSPGTFNITLTITDNSGLTGSVTRAVALASLGEPPLFEQDANGLVVMEAEDATGNVARSNHAWLPTTSLAGYSGTAAMRAMPNTASSYTSNIETTSPSLDFAIRFNRAGTHYIWFRASSTGSGADDSVHVGLNGTVVWSNVGCNAAGFAWFRRGSNALTINIPAPGIHTLSFYMREDGAYLDKLLVTSDANYPQPTDVGPAPFPQLPRPNLAPLATSPRLVFASVGASLAIAPGELGYDPDNAPAALVLASVGTASVGSATIEGGQLQWVPPANFVGTATIPYTLGDTAATAAGTFTILVGESLPGWRVARFGSGPVADPAREADTWGNAADPDRDGLPNLAEYLFGLAPGTTAALPADALRLTSVGPDLVLETLEAAGATAVVVTPQWSPDGQTWFSSGFGATTRTPEGTHWRVRRTLPLGAQATVLVRLSLAPAP